MKRVLVTGASGKSGSYFVKYVCENSQQFADYEWWFIVRSEEKGNAIKQILPNANILTGSLQDKAFLEDVFSDSFDVLLHIAGIHFSSLLTECAVKNNSVDWMIMVHTTGIYSKYKAAGEDYRNIEKRIDELLSGKDIKLTILRPTMIYGNINDRNISVFMKMVDKLRIFPVVSGAKYELQPVWCGDLGKAYGQVLISSEKTKGKQYNLSGKEPILLLDIFKIMAEYLGVKNIYISIPFWIAYFGAWVLYAVSFKKVDYREKVQRLVEPRVFSHKDASEDFGYAPVDFATGVKEEIEEYKKTKRR